jgi:DNA-directed RNA polymerase subunit H (RpoH/RPB5)
VKPIIHYLPLLSDTAFFPPLIDVFYFLEKTEKTTKMDLTEDFFISFLYRAKRNQVKMLMKRGYKDAKKEFSNFQEEEPPENMRKKIIKGIERTDISFFDKLYDDELQVFYIISKKAVNTKMLLKKIPGIQRGRRKEKKERQKQNKKQVTEEEQVIEEEKATEEKQATEEEQATEEKQVIRQKQAVERKPKKGKQKKEYAKESDESHEELKEEDSEEFESPELEEEFEEQLEEDFEKEPVSRHSLKYLKKISIRDFNFINHIMLITNTSLTKDAYTELKGIFDNMEFFLLEELVYDPTEHFLCPEFTLLTDEEAKKFLERNNLTYEDLPIISENDPISRYYGAKAGNIFKIKRTNMLLETFSVGNITFRVVRRI